MNKARVARWAVAGVGAAAAAVAAGVVVERRVVRSRKAGSRGADELGGLRGDPVAVRDPDRWGRSSCRGRVLDHLE